MVRTAPSETNKKFSLRFADIATAPTAHVNDMVARSGPLCIFAALRECFPGVVRIDEGGLSPVGVSKTQFNKVLQNSRRYERQRDRRCKAQNCKEDPVGAGMYLFSQRRWLDPADKKDRERLLAGWNELVATYSEHAQRCCLIEFLSIIERFRLGWQPSAHRAMKRARATSEDDDDGTVSKRMSTSSSPTPSKTWSCASESSEGSFSVAHGPAPATQQEAATPAPLGNLSLLGQLLLLNQVIARSKALPCDSGAGALPLLLQQQHQQQPAAVPAPWLKPPQLLPLRAAVMTGVEAAKPGSLPPLGVVLGSTLALPMMVSS